MKLHFSLHFILCALLLEITVSSAKADEAHQAVYVWDFSMQQDRKSNTITEELTEEFETALIAAQKYHVLERRDFDELIRQAGIESGIMNLKDINGQQKSVLQSQGADMVIFGAISDEMESTVISLTVTFEDWKGEKVKKEEIDIPRGDLSSKRDREAAMAELVRKITGLTPPGVTPGSTPDGSTKELNSVQIKITKCYTRDRYVIVEFLATDTGNLDLNLTLNARVTLSRPSTMVDDNGNRVYVSNFKIANQQGNGYVESLLISGMPVKCEADFLDVPADATMIKRFYLNMSVGKTDFGFVFSDLLIEK